MERDYKEFGTINREIRAAIANRILENTYSIYDLDLLLNDYLNCAVSTGLIDSEKLDIKCIRRTIRGL